MTYRRQRHGGEARHQRSGLTLRAEAHARTGVGVGERMRLRGGYWQLGMRLGLVLGDGKAFGAE